MMRESAPVSTTREGPNSDSDDDEDDDDEEEEETRARARPEWRDGLRDEVASATPSGASLRHGKMLGARSRSRAQTCQSSSRTARIATCRGRFEARNCAPPADRRVRLACVRGLRRVGDKKWRRFASRRRDARRRSPACRTEIWSEADQQPGHRGSGGHPRAVRSAQRRRRRPRRPRSPRRSPGCARARQNRPRTRTRRTRDEDETRTSAGGTPSRKRQNRAGLRGPPRRRQKVAPLCNSEGCSARSQDLYQC